MKVIKPNVIGAAQLISSNVPETDYPAWLSTTDYAVGARVVSASAIYESVQTPNLNRGPATSPLYWAKISATLRHMMFDGEVNTQTTAASPLNVVIAPGLVDSLALFNLTGGTVVVTVRDGLAGPVVYSYTKTLDGSAVSDWHQYFYQPFSLATSLVLTDLPLYGSAHITVEITGVGTVGCGLLVAGRVEVLGATQYGATLGIRDFSKKETNPTTGVTSFVRRKNSKTLSAQVTLPNYDIGRVFRHAESVTATPSVWVTSGVSDLETLTVYGFFADFSITVPYPTESLCSIEIEGLI